MNSTTLKETHQDVYKKFFNKYDLILSLPLSYQLTWDFYKFLWDTSMISYKIPLRIYIGINNNKATYSQIPLIYKTNNILNFKKTSLNSFFKTDKQILEDIGIKNDIWILSEYQDFNEEILLAGIIMAKLLIDKKIDKKKIENLDIQDNTHEAMLKFIFSYFLAYQNELKFLMWNGRHFENLIATSFLKSNSFIRCEKDKNDKFSCKAISNEKYFYKLNLSHYIINTNLPYETPFINNYIEDKNNEIKNFFSQSEWMSDNELIDWLKKLEKHFSLETLKNLKDITQWRCSWKNFFTNIENYYQIVDNIINSTISSTTKQLNKQIIKKELKENIFHQQSFSIKHESKIKIRTQKHIHLEQKHLDKINQKNWYNFSLDYNSNKDAFEKNWLIVEQFRSKNINSKMASNYKLKIVNIKWSFEETQDYEQATLNKDGLLFDTIDQKIYLFWKWVSSKELRSQSWTIEIINTLIHQIWENVSNKDLPYSTYSKSKNEMAGKIILPLKRLFKENTGKEFPLYCNGSLSNFSIRLENPEIPIYLIEKLEK